MLPTKVLILEVAPDHTEEVVDQKLFGTKIIAEGYLVGFNAAKVTRGEKRMVARLADRRLSA